MGLGHCDLRSIHTIQNKIPVKGEAHLIPWIDAVFTLLIDKNQMVAGANSADVDILPQFYKTVSTQNNCSAVPHNCVTSLPSITG